MDPLEAYLRGEFLKDLETIHSLGRTADDAVATLSRFEKNGEWPYELSQGEAPAYSAVYSFSTSAMILLAMAIVSRIASGCILAPSTSERDTGDQPSDMRAMYKSMPSQIRAGLDRLLQESTKYLEEQQERYCLRSKTFGDDDPFTILWLLELLRAFSDAQPVKLRYEWFLNRARDRVSGAFSAPTDKLQGGGGTLGILNRKGTLEHVFPLLRIVQIYHFLKSFDRAPEINVSGALHYLKSRLHQHLSYFSVPDSSFDAAELAFAMEACLLLDRESLDAPLVERCLEVLEGSQQRNPYWRPLRPFIANEQGMVLLPLSVEIANSMLRSCELLNLESANGDYLGRYVNLFKRYTKWLFTRIVRSRTKENQAFMGWHSEHADAPGKIHLWETSQVLIYVVHYEAILRRHRAAQSQRLSNLSITAPLMPVARDPLQFWNDTVQPKEPLRGGTSRSDYAVYSQIASKFIWPRIRPAPGVQRNYSMLLYGPQGTGKTTLAEDVARTLGQKLVKITPSDFTIGGEAAVEAQAKAIFDVLGAQSDCVILFDEIDRLILDRDSELYGKQGDIFQFMTPGMLTKFHDLRRLERVIFIVSTNFAERIDPAIKRVGRIDDQFLLLPPNTEQRRHIFLTELKQELSGISGHAQLTEEIEKCAGFPDMLKEMVFMIPGEIQDVASAAAQATPREANSILAAALNRTRRITPTIRLASYKPRFRHISETKPGTAQEPHLEFLMLVYLLFEAGRPLTAPEMKIVSDYAKSLPTQTDEFIREWITEPSIQATLSDRLSEAVEK
jgi:hypothetical protein